ncbi:MAG: sodium-translocating pyrophosphatase [Clostridia bacterium]|nr:sodium-translocating pyrophosphatase [Clostridia bacterium]
MELYFVIAVALCALFALGAAVLNALKLKNMSEGEEAQKKIASAIRQGANAYLKRQYTTVFAIFAVVFVIFVILSAVGMMSKFTPFAFITGGCFSALSGFIGMKIATYSNARTAVAAKDSLNKGLRAAFSAGSVMGLVVVGLGLVDMTLWYTILRFGFGLGASELANNMVTFGVGASFMALFARVGGGIFTKAADVGADLVGKVEAGIPEDDARNPAVIADNVGDNVGDVCGMGADLYESYVGSIVSAVALMAAAGLTKGEQLLVPLLIAGVGIIASIIGGFFVRTKENATQAALLKALRTGTNLAAILVAVFVFPIVWFLLGKEFLGVYFAVLCGLLAGVLIGFFTEYFTSDEYKPTKKLAATSETGTATIMIGGLSLGLKSTVAPVIIVAAAVLGSFFLAGGTIADPAKGLFGVAIAAVGMLSTLGITLATDAYGPVADNAGGIAEMSKMDPIVRKRTDALDSLGNTTAATGKGFAIGSAALTSLALIVSFKTTVDSYVAANGMADPFNLEITNPAILIGLFIGGMVTFLFAALTMEAVGKAAQSVVLEVRRQFREIVGIMEGKAEPDYKSCVDLCTKSALNKMIAPAIIALLVPIVTGLILGVNGIMGMLAGSMVTGFLLAVFMSNSGGAWDNAKKHIEAGNFGGKGSDCHKAAVVGDTVGDPFKDTAGPALNILIKFLSIVSIIFAQIIVNFSIM